MKIGQRSLLIGVRQYIWHPVTVWLAWHKLYGLPSLKETICIIIHDWGYWFCSDMDGEEGERHPEHGAKIALRLFGPVYSDMVLFHSRNYAGLWDTQPSKLYWADKLSLIYEPWWLYLPRAWASGELFEYREKAAMAGFIPLTENHRTWFAWIKEDLVKQVKKHQGMAMVNPVGI